MKHKTKVLFILKKRHDYNSEHHSNVGLSTGLYNSASFMNDMLNENGVHSEIVVVNDNNDIDREVKKHKPTHVIIEALWVVPEKFKVLGKLHPKVKWIIRLHSDVPFLANEGVAFDWIGKYVLYPNVSVAANSLNALEDLRTYIHSKYGFTTCTVKKQIIYLPNYYPQEYNEKTHNCNKNELNISCFGAIRPLKNQVIQAIASIKLAEFLGKKLNFHINSGRIEQKGESIYKNLKELFEKNKKHKLVINNWVPRKEFLKLCGKMDIGMQVSFSETFNIVSADVVSQSVPIVASNEIPWISRLFSAKTTSVNSIFFKLLLSYFFSKINVMINQYKLTSYTSHSRNIWLERFK